MPLLQTNSLRKLFSFKPKLIILIVPRETRRLDEKNSYDLIWEDDQLLEGKAFYLPGSIDGNDKRMDDWMIAPPLYLWSHRDWTAKHREIAKRQGHLPEAKERELCLLPEDSSSNPEMRAQVQMYGNTTASFASHLGYYMPVPAPGWYGPLGATLNPAYGSLNSSALNGYNSRLDDSNWMMTYRGGYMQHMGGQRGMHYISSHPGRGGHLVNFARGGPFPPFSQQNFSGWLNE